MHLDETMLQSNTAINLVEYIDELIEILAKSNKLTSELADTHKDIKAKHDKAMKRRSTKYRTDL